jgi:cobalt-zinc-cadmium efflux system outer membrane protein
MTPQRPDSPVTHRVSAVSRGRLGLAIIVLTGLGLQGCVGVLPDRTYESAAPPPFEALSEHIAEAQIDAASSTEETVHRLSELVVYALKNNPRIASAVAQYEAAVNQVPQVTALPDPKLSYRYFIQEVQTRVGAQQYAFGITQRLPWLGKLRLQGEVASQQARAAAARVSTIQNEIIANVASAWYELYYFERALEIMQGNRDLVVNLERVVRTRYSTGATSHADVIRAQVELGKIENNLASLSDREAPLLARLNASLNRPSNTAIAMPEHAPIERIPYKDPEIIARVTNNNSALHALEFDIAGATAAKERANKDFFPDFSVGIDYIATDKSRMPNVAGNGDDAVAAAITMTIPLQRDKYRAGVRAADARITGELARRNQHVNSLEAATVDALFRLRDAERQIDLYQTTLLPKANESLIVTQRAYSGGASTFTDLIDAQRVLLVFELAEKRAITDHNLARITLEELMGEPLGLAEVNKEQRDER